MDSMARYIFGSLNKVQIVFQLDQPDITHTKSPNILYSKHILAQLKKCGNKIVTLFIIVFENLHFSPDFFLAVPEAFLDLLAALGGPESTFVFFNG